MSTTNNTQIIVAVIGAVALIMGPIATTLILRAGQRDIKERVGLPNGTGSVIDQGTMQIAQNMTIIDQALRHERLDEQRFRALHDHLGISYDYPDEEDVA